MIMTYFMYWFVDNNQHKVIYLVSFKLSCKFIDGSK